MSAPDLVPVPASPGSDVASLVFDDVSSSDGIPSPSEPAVHLLFRSPRASSRICDVAKGIASVGVAVHSPRPSFVGTPFATGPATLFEYPFPAAPSRPSLSNASSLSSISSAVLGPPSPATRSKFHSHPLSRLSSQSFHTQPARRRFSGGNGPPPIRVPPRLRTDSSSSIASSVVDDPTITVKPSPTSSTPVPHSAPLLSSESSFSLQSAPRSRSPLSPAARSAPPSRLRNRSGSLGIFPIQLPPPAIPSARNIGHINVPTDTVSPAMLIGTMASPVFGLPTEMASARFASALRMAPIASSQDTIETDPAAGRRRASVPSLIALGEGQLDDERQRASDMGEFTRQIADTLRATDEATREEKGGVEGRLDDIRAAGMSGEEQGGGYDMEAGGVRWT